MKMISINTGWQSQRLIIRDDAKAETAYQTLKNAMSTYDRFGNDKEKAVSIIDEAGEATFKLEHLVAVYIEDLSETNDEVFLLCDERNRRLKSKLDAKTDMPVVTTRMPIETGNSVD